MTKSPIRDELKHRILFSLLGNEHQNGSYGFELFNRMADLGYSQEETRVALFYLLDHHCVRLGPGMRMRVAPSGVDMLKQVFFRDRDISV